ncbi:ER membrane protein complex subunit 2-A-like [Sitodiplosis mosellana]|uniref:ER membrane protein complex subunit 2-A-like n=1 Tax=Sitodiplosis mosellana TaxID=263140 RepID=UPI0024437447|nr:ER membrane protein complex subunit 2-A-like [Sitodiplosis mosellana]
MKMAYLHDDMSWSEVRDLFRKWREDNERRSDEVIHLWETVLDEKQHKLDSERHLVLEQVIIAALDCNRIKIAEQCIRKLSIEFPGSLRVQKFKAMRLEALEMFDEALDVLNAIIAQDETNAAPRKRKIAIYKAKGKNTDAIRELCEYTKLFMSDQEAWHELCNLYMAEGEFAKAAFCMEELLLHNPHSHLYHQRLAEIRYTMGGLENIELAKTYYSQAVKLNPNNLRALYGLYLCCNQISGSRSTVNKRKDAQKLAQLILTKIQAKYNNEAEDDTINCVSIPALENAFGNLDIKSN